MRTKTLLIAAAAALAAGIVSTQAQVYSQNIVGYVNIPVKTGFLNIANPLDESAGDSLTNVIVNTAVAGVGPWDYTTVSIWTGTSYKGYVLDSSMSTGVADQTDTFPVTAPTITPGQAFFFVNNTGSSNTLTIVGTVHVDGAGTSTNVVGVTTNTIGTNPSDVFIASKLPIAGGLGSVLGFKPVNGVPDYTAVNVPNINAIGQLTGFTGYTVDDGFPSGFADQTDSFGVAEPVIPVGGGFFFVNNTGVPVTWTQSY